MDKKQITILNTIIDKYKLSHNSTFIQHRNLKEFKYFEIERINPNHHILVLGKLKNNKNKHNHTKKFINVGEIIIGFTTIGLNFTLILENINFICILFNMFFINCLLFYIFGKYNIIELLYDNWHRFIFDKKEIIPVIEGI